MQCMPSFGQTLNAANNRCEHCWVNLRLTDDCNCGHFSADNRLNRLFIATFKTLNSICIWQPIIEPWLTNSMTDKKHWPEAMCPMRPITRTEADNWWRCGRIWNGFAVMTALLSLNLWFICYFYSYGAEKSRQRRSWNSSWSSTKRISNGVRLMPTNWSNSWKNTRIVSPLSLNSSRLWQNSKVCLTWFSLILD